MTRRPPRSPLFPYTPLSRSDLERHLEGRRLDHVGIGDDPADERVRGSRDGGNALSEEPAGARLRHAQAVAPATQCLEHDRSEEHTSELQSQSNLVCRLLLEK